MDKAKVAFWLSLSMASCERNEPLVHSVDNAAPVHHHESRHDDCLDIPPQFGSRADAVPKNNQLYTLVDNFILDYEFTENHILLFVVKLDAGGYEVMTQRDSGGGGAFLLLRINDSNIEVIDTIFYDN